MSTYKIRSSDPNMWLSEMNNILARINDRLDQLEGVRGVPRVYSRAEFEDDVVALSPEHGLVMADSGDPQHYWRLTMNTDGSRNWTDLGRDYRPDEEG